MSFAKPSKELRKAKVKGYSLIQNLLEYNHQNKSAGSPHLKENSPNQYSGKFD